MRLSTACQKANHHSFSVMFSPFPAAPVSVLVLNFGFLIFYCFSTLTLSACFSSHFVFPCILLSFFFLPFSFLCVFFFFPNSPVLSLQHVLAHIVKHSSSDAVLKLEMVVLEKSIKLGRIIPAEKIKNYAEKMQRIVVSLLSSSNTESMLWRHIIHKSTWHKAAIKA